MWSEVWTYSAGCRLKRRHMKWGGVGGAHPWGAWGGRGGGGWSYIKQHWEWSKKKKKEEALVLWRFRKGFFVRLPLLFSVWFLSLSLPPNLSLSHSEGSASSKDTLVDSRKSGCCRSDKNLVGVSVWVEPVEEQRWLHHSSLGTWHTPPPPTTITTTLSEKRVKNTHAQRHSRPLIAYTHARHVAQAHRHRERHGVAAIQRQQLFF